MTESGSRGHCLRVLMILGVLLLLLAALIGLAWQAKYAEYATVLADYHSDLARYRSELARRPALEAALRNDRTLNSVRQLYLAGATPSLAGAQLQARLRTQIEKAGGTLVSSQILEPVGEGAVQRLVVKVRMRADAAAMLDVLHGLESGEPALYVDALTVNASRTGRSQEMVVQFDLSGFLIPKRAPA